MPRRALFRFLRARRPLRPHVRGRVVLRTRLMSISPLSFVRRLGLASLPSPERMGSTYDLWTYEQPTEEGVAREEAQPVWPELGVLEEASAGTPHERLAQASNRHAPVVREGSHAPPRVPPELPTVAPSAPEELLDRSGDPASVPSQAGDSPFIEPWTIAAPATIEVAARSSPQELKPARSAPAQSAPGSIPRVVESNESGPRPEAIVTDEQPTMGAAEHQAAMSRVPSDPESLPTEPGTEADSTEQTPPAGITPEPAVPSTPAEWAERLRRAFGPRVSQPEREPSPRAGDAPKRPITERGDGTPSTGTPLSESARQFLRPMVGMDPATIELRHGPEPSRFLSAIHADAASTDASIVLDAHPDQTDAKVLGLMAHELTHIVRRSQPKFIPPIARASAEADDHTDWTATLDEEALAIRVESRVTKAAESPRSALAPTPRFEPAMPGTDETASSGGSIVAQADRWGGLPAPWEPMPDIPDTQVATTSPAAASGDSAATQTTVGEVVARAEVGRTLEDAGPAVAPAKTEPAPAQTIPPNLDALARQVYSALRRRLATDRRRELMR